MLKTTVIGFYGGPGSGKSTTAAKLFAEMKIKQFDCELVTEFAKDLVYADRNREFGNQVYIGVKQYHRLWTLRGKVEYVITDAPVMLNYVYHKNPPSYLGDMLFDMYSEFNNLNYLIKRSKEFSPKGRVHNEQQSIAIDQKIIDLLAQYELPFNKIETGETEQIWKYLISI